MDVGDFDPFVTFSFGDGLAFVVKDLDTRIFGELMPSFDYELSVIIGKLGFDFDAARAKIVELKMDISDADELHIAINATIEGEVSGLWIDPLVGAIIHANSQ